MKLLRNFVVWITVMVLLTGCTFEYILPNGEQSEKTTNQNVDKTSSKKDKGSDGPKPVLKVVSVSDSVLSEISDFELLTDCEVQLEVVDITGFVQMLLGELQNEGSSPDVVIFESEDLQNTQLSPYLLDLTDLEAQMQLKEVQNADVFNQGIDSENRLIGVTYMMSPVAFYYRRSLAIEALGTDDPKSLTDILGSYSRISRVSNIFEKHDIKFLPDLYAFRYFQNIDHTSWIDDKGLFVQDPGNIEFLNTLKQLKADQAVAFATEWSDAWIQGMHTTITDDQNKETRVFGYVLPSWGLQNVLMLSGPENGEDLLVTDSDSAGETESIKSFNPTMGDWAAVPIDQAGFLGGEYFSIIKETPQSELAKQFVQYMVADRTHLKLWSQRSHQLFADDDVHGIQAFEEEKTFLGGQDYETVFREIALKADRVYGSNLTDPVLITKEKAIRSLFETLTMEFIQGDFHTVDEAMTVFEGRVKELYPELFISEQ